MSHPVFIFLLLTIFQALVTHATIINRPNTRSVIYNRYTTAHSLGKPYGFDPRDGWESVNVTNLQYKYPQAHFDNHGESKTNNASSLDQPVLRKRKTNNSNSKSLLSGGSLTHAINSVWNNLKGLGKAEAVTITWYTGHDLLNPSCWSNVDWAPTDASFVSALTLEGWTNRPKCFNFLELCHGPTKCVFVRVVDTCAGCAAGSKHVDLTKSAFSQLASTDVGTLQVQMRPATDPSEWFENLWGPKQ
ncbi:hypothetical protein JAAARDRAFT_202137 [Jaapia argillacea MUCL 33604]|uniref:RlpA-like protein double-psi beta-barrel domain-containing protein n=1 Tax=Jaapia argillacea MUCL 33604 TaxID=933084 RepID=A0A067QMV1_9AGAM|nr:hypothetical protein JAAARDRAFT_202137 [Jaapia argillacea MUCL 33604]